MPQLGEIYYTQSGNPMPGHPSLVLIHGAGGSHLDWPGQLRRLPGEAVYALDLPGHGKSEGVGRQSIAAYAQAVLRWLEEMLLDPAILVGHSMGGAVAQTLALLAPERTAGLVLIGSGARLRVNQSLLESLRAERTFPQAVEQIMSWSFSPSAPESLLRLSQERMLQTRPPVFHGDLLACDAFDSTETIGALPEMPALVICGAADKMMPERHSRFLAEKIAGAILKVVPEAGHMVTLEQPAAVAEAVGGFVRRYWGESGE